MMVYKLMTCTYNIIQYKETVMINVKENGDKIYKR